MHDYGKASLVAIGLALMASTTAGAQASACRINDSSPYQLASAKTYLNKVRGTGKESEKDDRLRDAVRVVTENPEKIKNDLGREWQLAQALYLWKRLDTKGEINTRGELGYTTRPDEKVDLLLAVDSAFTAVETRAPECADSVARFRRDLWTPIINEAIQITATNPDSAEKLANRSLVIFRGAPHAYNLLANIATQKGDRATMVPRLRKVIEASGTDTANREMRQAAMFNLGVALTTEAEAATGADRTRLFGEARSMFEAYLKERPGDANAQAGLSRALQATGDTAAVVNLFAGMLADPAKYNEIQLFEAGVGAARAKRHQDAAKLFEAGLQKNPYHRDALYNLANMYLGMQEATKMHATVRRLIEVDPSNPNNWTLLAASYQAMARTEENAARKKALNDSVLKYIEKGEKLPVALTFTAFDHSGATHRLTGTIENRSSAAKTYNVRFEFLDASGKVVATKEQSVGPVAPKGTSPFEVVVEQSGIVAYRYAPLT